MLFQKRAYKPYSICNIYSPPAVRFVYHRRNFRLLAH